MHLLERTNFRYFEVSKLTEKPDLAVIDVSFISLAKILPKVAEALAPGGDVLALVKPQFEGTPKEVPGGFVKDEPTRQMILGRVLQQVQEAGFQLKGTSDSVLKGRKGNRERFFHLRI